MNEPETGNNIGRVKAWIGLVKGIGIRSGLGLCLAGLGLILFWWFSSEVFEGETSLFDETIRSFVRGFETPLLTRLMIVVSFVGSPAVLSMAGIPVAGVLLYLRRRRELVLFITTLAGAIFLNLLLKGLFQRPRPEAFLGYDLPASFSFPSGHALGAFCFYTILTWLITRGVKNGVLCCGIWILSGSMVLLIGLSRIYLGVHYPSDVLAGYLAAAIWVVSVALVGSYYKRFDD